MDELRIRVVPTPWNKGKLVGQKAPLKLKEIWAIRVRLQVFSRTRELALFDLGIDSKLRESGVGSTARLDRGGCHEFAFGSVLQRAGVDRTGHSARRACIVSEAVDRQADYCAERNRRRRGGNSEIAARGVDE